MKDKRPSPEKLLHRATEEAQQEKRGKLKIYLGAAPGVGKTYAMLHDALEKRAKNLDVVIGVVESHGRKDIESALKPFEAIPRQRIRYHGTVCNEFDLDKALQRNPGLILMDEMAHTNAPGLRHEKRWQDIKELLDRGIDVYTTLNVQHIESLKDDVAKIIQAPIKETVPDSLIALANTIELVDLPPEELLKRLQEGKIYVPEQAQLAIEHFFRKGNLIALRELALRTTAERVATDVLLYRQGEGIKQIWPTKEKILVCVGPKTESLKLIRSAKRIANSLQAEWLAVYIETPALQNCEPLHNRAIQNLRMAEELGATTQVLAGSDIVKEVLEFAHEQNVTQIVIWKEVRPRWQHWFRRNLADEILRRSADIDVYVMTGEAPEKNSTPKKLPRSIHWAAYGLSFGMVTLITIINLALFPYLRASNLVMIYLLGVTIVALLGERGPSILATMLSVIAYDFFFVAPYYHFIVSGGEYFFTLSIMLLLAQVISYTTITTRRQTQSARLIQHQTAALYSLSSQLTHTRGVNKVVELGTHYIDNVFHCDATVLLPKKNRLEAIPSGQSKPKLDAKEYSIATWVYQMGQKAGLGTDTLAFSKALYLPLQASQGTIGVLRVQPKTKQLLTPEQLRLLESCVNQLALALEVDRLQEKTQERELQIETERARTTLLQGISNDLNAPLQIIVNTLSQLQTPQKNTTQTLGIDIAYEIEKLNQLNTNILQIIQLETQHTTLKKTPSSLRLLINLVLKTSEKLLDERPLHLHLPKKIPPIPLNKKLIQGALFNLLDNAVKFSPPKSPIAIAVSLEPLHVLISVEDAGPGVAPEEKNKLFEKFYQSNPLGDGNSPEHGLGLGLTICQKIIVAHGGTIWVENLEKRGAAFRFTLPLKNL